MSPRYWLRLQRRPSFMTGEWHNAAAERRGMRMKRHVLSVVMSLMAAVISGAIFVAALFHEFALVEMAASILTGLQGFFLRSAIGDLLDKRKESNRARNSAGVVGDIFLGAAVSFRRLFR